MSANKKQQLQTTATALYGEKPAVNYVIKGQQPGWYLGKQYLGFNILEALNNLQEQLDTKTEVENTLDSEITEFTITIPKLKFKGKISKNKEGYWVENIPTKRKHPKNWGLSYQGYLTPGEILTWLRQDYQTSVMLSKSTKKENMPCLD